jgi:hypothetical protein
MIQLRCPVSILSAVSAQMIGSTLGAGGPAYIVPAGPPSQLGASGYAVAGLQMLPSTVFSAGTQKITLPAGMDGQLVITPALLRQVVGQLFPTFDVGRLPTEPLQLSQECAANFQGGWIALFQSLGFTAFAPTLGQVPTMNC